MKVSSILMCIVLILWTIFCSCIKESVVTPVEYQEVIIPETTKIINADDWTNYWNSQESNDSLFVFNASIGALYAIQVNNILAGGAEKGFLKRITAIQNNGSQILVSTEQTSIAEAVQRGHGSIVTKLSDIGNSTPAILRRGVHWAATDRGIEFDLNTLIYDADSDSTTTDDQIFITGSLCVDVIFDFEIRIENHQLEQLAFQADLNQEADLRLSAIQSFSLTKEIEIATIEAHSIRFYIGEFPVFITPVVTIAVGITGVTYSPLTVSTVHNTFHNIGVNYSSLIKWNPYNEFHNIYSNATPLLSGNAQATSYVTSRWMFKFYDSDGPYVVTKLSQEITANYTQTPHWQLFVGSSGAIGVKSSIFNRQLQDYTRSDLMTYRKKIAQGL